MKKSDKAPIIMPFGAKTKVATLMGCSRPTVIKALNGTYNENCTEERELALRIRKCALNNGGILTK